MKKTQGPKKLIKKESLTETLVEFGLSENEARTYLACLSLGPATILKIATTSELKRTTIYGVIESLKQKGLVKSEARGFKQRFIAESPSRLEKIIEERREKLIKKLPELDALFNLEGKESSFKYYQGIKGIKNVYDMLLEKMLPHEYYYAISNVGKWYNVEQRFFSKHIKSRSKLFIVTKLLLSDSEHANYRKGLEKNFNEEIHILPKEIELNIDLVVTPHYLVLFELSEPLVALVIENKCMIAMAKVLFELLWKKY